MKRRNFLHISAGATLGAGVIPSMASGKNTPEQSSGFSSAENSKTFVNNNDDSAEQVYGQILCYSTVEAIKAASDVKAGSWIETTGFHLPGDGGSALYHVQQPGMENTINDADVIKLNNGLVAILTERESVNYKMFGTHCDGESDDGVQIRLAHEYANLHKIPVINTSGEFRIKRTNGIPITTSVQWGSSIFHIDERFNTRATPRFIIQNDLPNLDLTQDENLRNALITKLKPGVQIITELAPYAGHLLNVQDSNDRIGIRAGYEGNRGWAREELLYIEEEGRIIGDIAWEFNNLTSVVAIPCNNHYLVIQGGGFFFSGNTPEGSSPGYHHHGISVRRSRTIIREQWMGLEPGAKDMSLEPRTGFYVLNGVYDVTLENIRAMPWEKDRRPPNPVVQHGTYGISGVRMLNCTFRNLTAEGGWVAWGVFGTNLNKNFRLENCRLNRIDIHFHCWNLYINNCVIGFKGISVTGGGDLFVNDTVRHGNNFISFRRDYGARWDGPIRLTGCTLKPANTGRVSVLNLQPSDFDYKYPLSLGSSVVIENLCIDYSAVPGSTSPCWMLDIAQFSRNSNGQRLLFPHQLIFRNIKVTGREQGIRLIRISNPYHYMLYHTGGDDGIYLKTNCTIICDNVHLEKMIQASPGDPDQVHLLIGNEKDIKYADENALYPKIVFSDCENVSLCLLNCAANLFLERCTVNTVNANNLQGELNFSNCRLQPNVREVNAVFYQVVSKFGTRFTNCTIHAPVIDGKLAPDLIGNTGFLEINKSIRHYHLNTALGAEVLKYLKGKGIVLNQKFIAQLKSHHILEE